MKPDLIHGFAALVLGALTGIIGYELATGDLHGLFFAGLLGCCVVLIPICLIEGSR